MLKEIQTYANRTTKDNWEKWEYYRKSFGKVMETVVNRYSLQGERLLLLGVGNGNDIHIDYIEDAFNKITLVDIDEEALDRFLNKTHDKSKYSKQIIDLSGLQQDLDELQRCGIDGDEFLRRIPSLDPKPDLSDISGEYDLIVNCNFSSQLISPLLIEKFNMKEGREKSTEFTDGILDLNDKIHERLFQQLHKKLKPNGIVIHATDAFMMSEDALTGTVNDSTYRIGKLINGDLNNLFLVAEQYSTLAKEGHALIGSNIPNNVMNQFDFKTAFTLFWNFSNTSFENRRYIVICRVLMRKN